MRDLTQALQSPPPVAMRLESVGCGDIAHGDGSPISLPVDLACVQMLNTSTLVIIKTVF